MYRYGVVAFFFVVMLPAYAMSDVSQWVKAIERASFVSVEQTLDGGYIAAGSKEEHGTTKALLVRSDSSGNIQWAKTYQLSYDDRASMVLRTGDGGFVFTGYTSENEGDAFLIKTDATGKILSQKLLGTSSEWEEGIVILRASDKGFFLLGNSSSGVWCMKLDSQRKSSWFKFYGRNTSLADAIRTRDGGFIFTGGSRQGPIIVKVNAAGNIRWQKNLEAPGMPSALTATADGGYVVGGIMRFWGIRGWAVKLDSVGNVSWSKSFPGQIGGVVEAVRQEKDGHILVMGFTAAGEHRYHIWSARFDLKGGLISQEAYGEARKTSVQIGAIHGTPDDGTLFVGSREANSRAYGLIARTTWEGNVCTAFEKKTGVLISNSIFTTKSAHLRIREASVAVRKPNFVENIVAAKIIDLCK